MPTRFHPLLQRLMGQQLPSHGPFLRAAAVAVLVPTLLAACAAYTGYGPQGLAAGTSEAEVLAQMGPATGRHALPGGGTRLEFARGPMGRHTYMLDMGADGRLLRWAQVLNEASFAQVTDGMPVKALLQHLGRPAERMGVRMGEVWSWRYANNDCLWFRVDITPQGQVRNGGTYGFDPACDMRDAGDN